MQRGHRPVGALGHGVEQGQDLLAAGLADDDPVGGHAQRPADQLGQADPALAFQVRLAGLERDDVGVQLGEAVEAQLEGVLDGDQPLGRVGCPPPSPGARWSCPPRCRRR